MQYYLMLLLVSVSSLISCSSKKSEQNQLADSVRHVHAEQNLLATTIDSAISVFERRLDIKMKHKTYVPARNSLVTLQKWFEFGDTTKLVKLREEILTNDTKMEVIQYHFVGDKLAQVHDYLYDKNWANKKQQYMSEAKYYFQNDSLFSAQKREAFGRADSLPVIERATFFPFQPEKDLLVSQLSRLELINKKYNSLPYPKPRS